MNIQLKQLKKQVRREFRKRFKNPKNTGYRVGGEFLGAVELYLDHKTKTAYQAGQMNPPVGFLRQYLNESPNWKGKQWTDEDLLDLIGIGQSKPTTQEDNNNQE